MKGGVQVGAAAKVNHAEPWLTYAPLGVTCASFAGGPPLSSSSGMPDSTSRRGDPLEGCEGRGGRRLPIRSVGPCAALPLLILTEFLRCMRYSPSRGPVLFMLGARVRGTPPGSRCSRPLRWSRYNRLSCCTMSPKGGRFVGSLCQQASISCWYASGMSDGIAGRWPLKT